MTDREDELGRILSTLLLKEADAMQIDTPTAAQRLEREITRSRQRRRVTVGVAAGLAAAVVLGLVLWNQASSPEAPLPADQPRDTQEPATPYFLDLSTNVETPLSEELVPDPDQAVWHTYSPDGTAVAVDCVIGTCGGTNSLQIVSADGSVTVVPVPSEINAHSLAWSRDGTKLLYRQTEHYKDLGDLYVYDLDQADSTQLTDLGLENVYWVDLRAEFSPDGDTVIFHRPRTGTAASKLDVWTVPVTGGEPTLVFRDAAQPEFLPDGSRIAIVEPESTSLTGTTVAVATPGDPPQPLFDLPEEIIDYQLSPDGTRALTSAGDGMQMVDVATGEVSDLSFSAQWAGNDRLLVTEE